MASETTPLGTSGGDTVNSAFDTVAASMGGTGIARSSWRIVGARRHILTEGRRMLCSGGEGHRTSTSGPDCPRCKALARVRIDASGSPTE